MNSREKIIFISVVLMTGIYFSLPNILIPYFRNDDKYTPLLVNGVFAYSRDQTTYAFLARDFYEGNIPGDPTLYEHKGRLNPFIPLVPTAVLAWMTLVAGSVTDAFILGNFIFPIIIFLIAYGLLYRQTRNFYISLLSPVVMLLAFDYVITPPLTLHNIIFHLTNIVNASGPLNYFSRIPHIQMSFIFLLTPVALLYMTMEKRKAAYTVACGLAAGLLFYTYVFYWTIFLGVLGIHFLYFLAKKNITLLKQTVLILAVFLLTSVPFWASYMSYGMEFTEDISVRNGKMYSGGLPLVETAKYGLILVFFYALSNKKDYFFLLMSSLILSGMLLMNSQVITGFSIQKSHYEFAMAPFASIIIVYSIWRYGKHFPSLIRKNYKPITTAIIIILLAAGLYAHYTFAKNKSHLYALEDGSAELYSWLNANTMKDDVVLTLSTEENHLIPVYTHNNVYLPYGAYSLAMEDEIWERFYISYLMLGVNVSQVEKMLNNEETRNGYIIDHTTNTFDKSKFEIAFWKFYLFSLRYSDEISDEKKSDVMRSYMSSHNISKYRIDYVVIGPYEREISAVPVGESLWSNGKFDVYMMTS